MSPIRPRVTLATLALLAISPSCARAGAISQTQDFSYTFTAFTNANTLSFTPIPAGGFVATFNPFGSSLGTLISTTVTWSITSAFNGIAGSTSSSYSSNFGGTYSVNSAGYSGNGGGSSTNANTIGATMSSSATVPETDTFLPADAGVNYDPAIEAAFTGTSPFSVSWAAGGSTSAFTADYVSSGTLSVTGSASITYNYQAVPEPASALILFPGMGLLVTFTRRRPG